MKALGPSAGICRGAACKALFDVFEFVCFCHESRICSCSFFCLVWGDPFCSWAEAVVFVLLVSFFFVRVPPGRTRYGYNRSGKYSGLAHAHAWDLRIYCAFSCLYVLFWFPLMCFNISCDNSYQ